MVKRGTITIGEECYDSQAIAETVIKQLKRTGMYSPEYLYRGFDGLRLEDVLKHGTDCVRGGNILNTIFACEYTDIIDYGTMHSPLDYAFEPGLENPALAIYDKLKLHEINQFEYMFNDSEHKLDALVAVYIIREKNR
jgi:hypothetical protein